MMNKMLQTLLNIININHFHFINFFKGSLGCQPSTMVCIQSLDVYVGFKDMLKRIGEGIKKTIFLEFLFFYKVKNSFENPVKDVLFIGPWSACQM